MRIQSVFEDQELHHRLKTVSMTWINTSYAHMGVAQGTVDGGGGVDCTKLVALILIELGIFSKIEDCYYDRDWYITSDVEVMLLAFSAHCARYLNQKYDYVLLKYRHGIPLAVGDIICFAVKERGLCNHTALYMGKEQMLHAIEGPGVHVARLNDHWRSKARFIFRITR